MRESVDSTKSKGAMKVKGPSQPLGAVWGPRSDLWPASAGAQDRPVSQAATWRRSESAHVGTRKMVNYA